ncbi:hypothetical protein [Fodinibius sp.]|uniref:hypothetical protein n=1 Tax=Fodinibius sp. TaxID=1872440 RepID=UPI00356721D1
MKVTYNNYLKSMQYPVFSGNHLTPEKTLQRSSRMTNPHENHPSCARRLMRTPG